MIKRIANRQWLATSLVGAVLLFPLCVSAQGQQTTKLYRIGYLTGGSLSFEAALGQGLRDLGYVEGKNIIIERRSADGKLDRLAALAEELVRLKVDVIVTAGLGTTGPAHAATKTIPIVMTQDQDPVSNGFVASLARPGGNITGLSTLAPEISGKRLELLNEVLPNLSRVAILGTSTSPSTAEALRETELAAAAFAVNLQYLDVRTPKDVETAFRAARKRTCGRSPGTWGSGARFSAITVSRSRSKQPAPGNILEVGYCGRRRTYELRRELARLKPPRRDVCSTRFSQGRSQAICPWSSRINSS